MPTEWPSGDARTDFLMRRNSFPDRRSAGAGEIGGDLSKIGDGPLRIFDPHVGRNTANAALTSSSLAASPASPSSIAANSSGVASYSALASSASISSAISASRCCPYSGQVGTRSNIALTSSLVMSHLIRLRPSARQHSTSPLGDAGEAALRDCFVAWRLLAMTAQDVIASEAVAVGTGLATSPPRRSRHAAFPHRAPVSG